MTIEVGNVLCGKYRLEASIGKGGMGEVFAASQLDTGERVAIKVVSRSVVGDSHVQRLYREAVAASRVRSEFVPRLLDVARDETGELFLAMELLHGETLAERLRRVGVLSWEEVHWIGEQVLRGLIDAHAAGVVHRDLKPGNIFIDVRPGEPERAKILDFGVCKLDSHDAEHLTATGEALGTVAYMAPEQIRGASKVDERADLYSFGMFVFEALSGRLAHEGTGQMAVLASKLERSARPLREVALVPVPPGLEALVARALSRKPSDRFSSAEELLRAWNGLGAPTVMPRASARTNPAPPAGHTQTALSTVTIARAAPRASKAGLAIAAGALLGASVLLVFVLSGRQSVSSTPPPRAAISPPAADDTSASMMPPADPLSGAAAVLTAPAAADAIDLDPISTDAGQARPLKKPVPRARPRPVVVPSQRRSSGPHIQEQPRY